MAPPQPSYTRATHSATYPAIDPSRSDLSTVGKVVVITGASGGIGRGASSSFAVSGPRALILLGRCSDALDETATSVRAAFKELVVQTHQVDLCDMSALRDVLNNVTAEFGGIDILVHCAGVLAPVIPLLNVYPVTFLEGYKTTVIGTLNVAKAVVLANKDLREITFINLTTAGTLLPQSNGMGADVSSKMEAVNLLQSFAGGNPQVRLHHVHPGFLDTLIPTQLGESIQQPFNFEGVSLSADFLVWIASPEAKFLHGKLVFSAWDVEELKSLQREIVGGPPGIGELRLGFQESPGHIGDQHLPDV
ncbi:cellulase signal transduction associated dehydrogenase [Ustulina deusta]|nr:cellulase signal transduction associated dehydrogenase [Ustulina deusta]